jgi:hypothetical protein
MNFDTGSKKLIRLYDREFWVNLEFPEIKVVQFLDKVEFREDGCWIFTGGKVGGYGRFNWQNFAVPAHRFSYQMLVGSIAPGKHLHHECNTPSCVNPAHLTPVDPRVHAKELTPNSITAISAAATICPNGHELVAENVQWTKQGKRRCKACLSEWRKKQYKAKPRPPRTHCKYGHELTPENSYEYMGKVQCRRCHANLTNRQYHDGRDKSPTWRCGHEKSEENTHRDKLGRGRCAQCFWEERGRKKEFCKKGHRYEDVGVYVQMVEGRERRFCKACANETAKKRYEKQKAERQKRRKNEP